MQKRIPLCFEFSLCLSRACLGKMIVFSIHWHKRCVFLPAPSNAFTPIRGPPRVLLKQCALVFEFEFSLCLSRACLGKMIICVVNAGQKHRFAYRPPSTVARSSPTLKSARPPLTVRASGALFLQEETRPFLSCPYLELSRACLGKSSVSSLKTNSMAIGIHVLT